MKKVSPFGEEIKRIRKSKGMSIRSLSEQSGVSHSYISQIENGNRDVPQPELIKKIANGLGVDYFFLMRIAGFMNLEIEKESVNIPELIKTFPIEDKKQILYDYRIRQFNSFPKFDNPKTEIDKFWAQGTNKMVPIDSSHYDDKDIDEINDSFEAFLSTSGTAGDFLKILRIHRNIDIEEMASHLNLDSKTYQTLEKNLKNSSSLLKEYGEKIGEILGVGNFGDWFREVVRSKTLESYIRDYNESDTETISFSVKSVYKKTDENGVEYYVTYTYEELERNFFNLDNLLNQKEHDVLYKDKVLSKSEIGKVKAMLKLLLEDDL